MPLMGSVLSLVTTIGGAALGGGLGSSCVALRAAGGGRRVAAGVAAGVATGAAAIQIQLTVEYPSVYIGCSR